MTDYVAIRKLAEDAIDEARAYRRGEGRNPNALFVYHNAAGPYVFLDLLDRLLQAGAREAGADARIKELEAEIAAIRAEKEKTND